MKICTVEGCGEKEKCKGLCAKHYRRLRVHGRLHTVLKVNKGLKCAEPGCERRATSRGLCQSHYGKRMYRADLPGFKKSHPFHAMWFERKSNDGLCDEWLDFWKFVADIGERPGKSFTLVKLKEGKYGPDNFRWRPHLTRESGESLKAWHARKWQARKDANPGWDNKRKKFGKYGVTAEDYERMLAEQDKKCAICEQPERNLEHWKYTVKNLSIDHCHATGKVRGLLCSRCNVTLGQVEDSIELLGKMQVYLRRHLACEAA